VTDVLVAGDVLVRRDAPVSEVHGDLRQLIAEAKVAMVNLAGPWVDGAGSPTAGRGLDHLAHVGFDVFGLLNGGLWTVGSGAAPGPLRAPIGERWLSVLRYRETAETEGAAACRWSLAKAVAEAHSAKERGDHVLVVLHGGEEHFPLPRRVMRDDLRVLAASGADAIVMHGSHVVSAYEVWEGVPIFYGLGNFQWAAPSARHRWYEGLVVAFIFPPDGPARFRVEPVVQSRHDFAVRCAPPGVRAEILNELEGHRLQVASDPALEARWEEFATDRNAATRPGVLRRWRDRIRSGLSPRGGGSR
jgi:hypothetical protein